MKMSLKSLLLCSSILVTGASGALAETVLHRGNSGDPGSIDPHKTSTVTEAHILRDLFLGLTAHDSKAELLPGAAESWTVSEDGKVYTFKMRAGATWSDGSPVTAEDFVYSWQRVVDPATASEYSYMLAPVVNAEAITAGEKKPEELGIQAIDSDTGDMLQVTLNAATPYFLEMLTHQATYPVNKANVEKFGEEFTKPGNLVSNGAFTLAEFIPNDHITLAKNPTFYDAANVALDKVMFYPTEDRSAAIKRFEAGELDLNDDLPTEQLADMKAKFGDQVKIGPYMGTYYYVFKTDKAPWDNVELRQAISMAVDRDYLASEVWQNTMIPAYSLVPPGIEGYTQQNLEYAEMSQIDREDKAREILTKLGYTPENPLKMEIRFNTSENHTNTAVAIQEQLKPLGVEVTMVNTDLSTHYDYLEDHGDFDIARGGWIADYKDAESFLSLCKTGTGNNYGIYSNAEYDKLLADAAASGDADARLDLLSKAEAIGVGRDLCMVPLLYYSFHSIVSDKVKGWEPNVMDIHPSRFMSK